jgi:hypothetical protein
MITTPARSDASKDGANLKINVVVGCAAAALRRIGESLGPHGRVADGGHGRHGRIGRAERRINKKSRNTKIVRISTTATAARRASVRREQRCALPQAEDLGQDENGRDGVNPSASSVRPSEQCLFSQAEK